MPRSNHFKCHSQAAALAKHNKAGLVTADTEYESVAQLKGSLSQKNCPAPSTFERAQYMRAISSYPLAKA